MRYLARSSRLDCQFIWKGRRALSRRETIHSDFLTPPVLKEAIAALEKLSDVKAVAQGGYPEARKFI